MSKILVLGGGIIGLSTAMMLVRRGHDVTVFERDCMPLPASPEDAWQGWERRGVAQFRQPHYLHPPAIELLDSHLPDVKEALTGHHRGALRRYAEESCDSSLVRTQTWVDTSGSLVGIEIGRIVLTELPPGSTIP